MGQRRIGSGPAAELLGRVLATVLACADEKAVGGGVNGVTAEDLARLLIVTCSEARVAAWELARSGCLRVGSICKGRAQDGGRYAQSFALPIPGHQHGAWRHPRLCPTGLLMAADFSSTVQLARVLRIGGMVPVAVHSLAEGRSLLSLWAFELVVLACPSSQESLTVDDLKQVRMAMHDASCGPLLVMGGGDSMPRVPDVPGHSRSHLRVSGHVLESVRGAVAQTLHDRVTVTAMECEPTHG